MTATTYPTTHHVAAPASGRRDAKRLLRWAGDGCRLVLIGLLIVMHLPMLIFIAAICTVGAAIGRRK
jgi:hypothetical protein